MQQALLIDEIIRQIFLFAGEHGFGTLNALARSCKAWAGPALDLLWTHLHSIAPLLELIPHVEMVGGMYVLRKVAHSSPDLTRFHLYASRVKHISHRPRVRVHLAVLSILSERIPSTVMLPCLRSARLSASNCNEAQTCLSLSRTLSKLDLDLGFNGSNEHISQYLQDVVVTAPGLQRLSIRGSLSEARQGLVSSMRNLHALSLRLGSSLTIDAVLAIAGLPNLSELELHTHHIDASDLSAALVEKDAPLFPSLTQLHMRAHTPVHALILDRIPIDILHTLRIEVEEPTGVPPAWSPIFNTISNKAANSLRTLTIEHHFEADAELENSADTTGPSPGPPIVNTPISFTDLRLLGCLQHLEKFVLDTTVPPVISDTELENLVKGWPEVQHLYLCPLRPAESLTFRSLATLAATAPKLRNLALAADLTGFTVPLDSPRQYSLTRLTLSCAPPLDIVRVTQDLHQLFPALREVEGLVEHDDEWRMVRSAMQELS